MTRRLRIIVMAGLAAVGVSAVGIVSASAIERVAQPGEPPSLPFNCDQRFAPCDEPVVLATGEFVTGSFELVGVKTAHGGCIFLDFPSKPRESGAGACPGVAEPDQVVLSLYGWEGEKPVFTRVWGVAGSEVDELAIAWRKRGTKRTRVRDITDIDPALAVRAGFEEGSNPFVAELPRCVEPWKLRITAYSDSQGKPVPDVAKPPIPEGNNPPPSPKCSR